MFGHRPGKYGITLQAISAVHCNSSHFGNSILTENVVIGYGNLIIFGGLPKPEFRHGNDIRVGGVCYSSELNKLREEASDVNMHETKAFSITEVNK